jgi:hypothetical protein
MNSSLLTSDDVTEAAKNEASVKELRVLFSVLTGRAGKKHFVPKSNTTVVLDDDHICKHGITKYIRHNVVPVSAFDKWWTNVVMAGEAGTVCLGDVTAKVFDRCVRMHAGTNIGILSTMGLYIPDADMPRVVSGLCCSEMFPSLRVLNLTDTCLFSKGASTLASAIEEHGGLPLLEQLGLSENSIGDDGVTALASVLGRDGYFSSLVFLDLSFNRFGDDGVASLAAAISQKGVLPSLKVLDLEVNYFGDAGITALASALSNRDVCPSLHQVLVEGIETTTTGSEAIKSLRTSRPTISLSRGDAL